MSSCYLIDWLKIDPDYHSFSAEDKLECLLELMSKIVAYDCRKVWRHRFASEQQFAEEYPDDYEDQLIVAWTLIKQAYTDYFQDINDAAKKLDKFKSPLFEILKKFGEDDMDRILLESDEQ